MSKKNGLGKFFAGAALGAGLGLLFAPKKGSALRADLKDKIDELISKIKELDVEDVKAEFDEKLAEIKAELEDLDKEKVLDIAEKKAEELKEKAEDLVNLAIEKGTPVLRDAAEEVRKKAIAVTKDVLKKLQAVDKK